MINPEQLEMITVDMLVSASHTYRKVMKVLDFKKITKSVKSKEREKAVGAISKMLEKGLHPMVILRENMKAKNRDLDSWISKLRSPYERTFSKQNKRVRYQGVAKNQAAEYLYAIAYNVMRLIAFEN